MPTPLSWPNKIAKETSAVVPTLEVPHSKNLFTSASDYWRSGTVKAGVVRSCLPTTKRKRHLEGLLPHANRYVPGGLRRQRSCRRCRVRSCRAGMRAEMPARQSRCVEQCQHAPSVVKRQGCDSHRTLQGRQAGLLQSFGTPGLLLHRRDCVMVRRCKRGEALPLLVLQHRKRSINSGR